MKNNTPFSKNIYTNKLGFARTLLAVGFLVTLLFNSKDVLMLEQSFLSTEAAGEWLDTINLFSLWGWEQFIYAKICAIIVLLLVISGWRPQITGILHWWVCFSYFCKGVILDGGDQIMIILTLILIPITLLDPRKNHWDAPVEVKNEKRLIAAGAVLLMIKVQMAYLYLQASTSKVAVAEWMDGTAIYYWMNNNLFGPSGVVLDTLNFMFQNDITVASITYSSLILEVILFGGLFMQAGKKRNILYVFAIFFHLSIGFFFGLISFFFSMAAGLSLYLLDLSKPFNIPTSWKTKFSIKKPNTLETTGLSPLS